MIPAPLFPPCASLMGILPHSFKGPQHRNTGSNCISVSISVGKRVLFQQPSAREERYLIYKHNIYTEVYHGEKVFFVGYKFIKLFFAPTAVLFLCSRSTYGLFHPGWKIQVYYIYRYTYCVYVYIYMYIYIPYIFYIHACGMWRVVGLQRLL